MGDNRILTKGSNIRILSCIFSVCACVIERSYRISCKESVNCYAIIHSRSIAVLRATVICNDLVSNSNCKRQCVVNRDFQSACCDLNILIDVRSICVNGKCLLIICRGRRSREVASNRFGSYIIILNFCFRAFQVMMYRYRCFVELEVSIVRMRFINSITILRRCEMSRLADVLCAIVTCPVVNNVCARSRCCS